MRRQGLSELCIIFLVHLEQYDYIYLLRYSCNISARQTVVQEEAEIIKKILCNTSCRVTHHYYLDGL